MFDMGCERPGGFSGSPSCVRYQYLYAYMCTILISLVVKEKRNNRKARFTMECNMYFEISLKGFRSIITSEVL